MEEPPGHGADVVEEAERGLCVLGVDGVGADEEPQVGVDLFG
jgi:hypothetical protein